MTTSFSTLRPSGWTAPVVAGLLTLFAPPATWGQTADLSVEVGGSSVSPPAGIEGDDARFLVAGIRALRFNAAGSGLLGSFLVGRAWEDGAGGDFLSGALEGAAWHHLNGGWSAGLEVKGFGFRVEEPFPYRSLGVEGGPTLRFTNRTVSATLRGIAGVGWSETELQRTGRTPSQWVSDELWRYGGAGELLVGKNGILGGLAVGLHEGAGGTYRSAGARFIIGRGGPALELRLDAWKTPGGSETTGGLAFIVPVRGWSLRGFLGRTEPDPLTLSEPGGGAGGVLLGRRLLGRDPLSLPRPPLHRIVDNSRQAPLVEIRVRAPEGTDRVELMGDFTFWDPVPMARDGSHWTIRLEIPAGTHHFGFLADDVWFLPESAPDTVPDEWGRRNATLVIEQ